MQIDIRREDYPDILYILVPISERNKSSQDLSLMFIQYRKKRKIGDQNEFNVSFITERVQCSNKAFMKTRKSLVV